MTRSQIKAVIEQRDDLQCQLAEARERIKELNGTKDNSEYSIGELMQKREVALQRFLSLDKSLYFTMKARME
jgi:uncharacterized coiled-coil DUF342 family protein